VADDKGGRRQPQDPTLILAGVARYVLRAVPVAEATLNNSGTATKAGFYVSHNPSPGARAVLIEALGFGNGEAGMLERYKTSLGRALRSTLSVNPDQYLTIVNTGDGGMLRLTGLSDGQIAQLQQRYSAR
jgi:hypothetical protein